MKITISYNIIKAIGIPKLKPFGIEEDRRAWQDHEEIDLSELSEKQTDILYELIKPLSKAGDGHVKGASQLCKDIAIWMKAVEKGEDNVKAKNAKEFHTLVTAYLRKVPGHRVFRYDDEIKTYRCYYVSETQFVPRKVERFRNGQVRVTPAHVILEFIWVEYGGKRHKHETFWPEGCIGFTANEALIKKKYLIETEELRKDYLAQKELFHKAVDNIGMQFLAIGNASDDCDGNDRDEKDDRDRYSRWYRSTKDIVLDKWGMAANVVSDVFSEEDKANDDRDEKFDVWFWDKKPVIKIEAKEDDDEEDSVENSNEEPTPPEIEVPLNPMLVIFDLKKQLRLKVHVSQLQEYKYDKNLGEKLILPEEQKELITTLLSYHKGFKDIVRGKGNGAIVLCAGPPGTGKTLTSEVFAEVSERPLYTVQCSQLGTNPDDLEDELLKVFARAQRWNAILLLDEADVYVSKRGHDLVQNSIVGVFLRTLEYYNGVMFLTTNKEELVDDAIASRCMARILYRAPEIDAQRKIWRVLMGLTGLTIEEKELDKIMAEHKELTGRDIKNLIKLAIMMLPNEWSPITAELINKVKKFKPTN